MRSESVLSETLKQLGLAGILREPDDGSGRLQVAANAAKKGLPLLDASSNDYLGFAELSVHVKHRRRPGRRVLD